MSASKTIEDVFISYANSRREETETLAAALQAAGFSTWWDTGLLPGDRFRAEIDEHLNGCRAAIIVWAPESIKSDWVLAEADHAWQLGKLVNVHVPGQKPRDIPKPFNQSHSVELANRSAIIEAVRKRIAAPAANEPTPEVSKVLADAAGPANTTHGMRRTIGWVVGVIATVVAIGTATVTLLPRLGSLASAPPQWTFKGDLFIGQPIPLAWSSNRTDADGRSAASVLFENRQFVRQSVSFREPHRDLCGRRSQIYWPRQRDAILEAANGRRPNQGRHQRMEQHPRDHAV